MKFTLSSDANLTSSLFLKRPQFADEKELRLVFNVCGREPHKYISYKINRGLLSYKLTNPQMIRKVVCHPCMPKRRFNSIAKHIKSSGWRIASVSQSDLYELPKTVFNIF